MLFLFEPLTKEEAIPKIEPSPLWRFYVASLQRVLRKYSSFFLGGLQKYSSFSPTSLGGQQQRAALPSFSPTSRHDEAAAKSPATRIQTDIYVPAGKGRNVPCQDEAAR